MAAFLGKAIRVDDLWKIEVIVRCPFGRRPDRTYYAVTDDGLTFYDSSSAQTISDASLTSRLKDRLNAELAKS